MEYHVPTSAIPLLMDPPFVAWLVLLGTAIGDRALRLLRAPLEQVSALERGVLSAALGLGGMQFVPFGLGMAGEWTRAPVLTPRAIWIALAAMTVLFLPDMARVVRGVGRALGRVRQSPPPRWIVGGLLILVVPFTFALLQALCPVTEGDGLGYHLTGPMRWLQAGRMHYLPTLVHTNSPMGVEMLFTYALAVWSDTAATLIHFALGLLTVAATYALGLRLRNQAVGFAAAFACTMGLPGNSVWAESSWAYVDLGLAFAMLCAVLAWVLWRRTAARGWLWCAALCAGAAASFKLTGLFVGIALGVMTAIEARGMRDEGRGMRTRTSSFIPHPSSLIPLFLALSLLPALPWLWRARALTGNPVYPFYPGLFPTKDWNPQADLMFRNFFKYYSWAVHSTRLTLEIRKIAILAAMAVIVVLAALLMRKWQDREGRALLGLTAALTVISLWSAGFYLRYFLPLMPLFWLALFLRMRPEWLVSRGFQAGLFLVVGVSAALYARSAYAKTPDALAAAAGRVSREAYLARYHPLHSIWSYVNTRLPQGTRLLVTMAGDTYYSKHDCFLSQAYHQQRIRLDTWENYLRDIQGNGIGYAITFRVPFNIAPGPADYAPIHNEYPFSRRLVQEYGHLLCAAGYAELHRLENLPQRQAASAGRP